MELYSHSIGLKDSGKFESHNNLSKDFLIDLEDIAVFYLDDNFNYNSSIYSETFSLETKKVLAKIYRYILERPLHEIDMNSDFNKFFLWRDRITEIILNKQGSQIFDLITILLEDIQFLEKATNLFDKYCITHEINKKTKKIQPRLNKQENEVFQEAVQILQDDRLSSSNAYFNEALDAYQAGKHKDAVEKFIKSLETNIKIVLVNDKYRSKSLGDLIQPLIDMFGKESEVCLTQLHKFWGTASQLIRHGNANHTEHKFNAEETSFVLVYISNLISYINKKSLKLPDSK